MEAGEKVLSAGEVLSWWWRACIYMGVDGEVGKDLGRMKITLVGKEECGVVCARG